MNKYRFSVTDAKFVAPKEIEYNEVLHKILNEEVEDIKLTALADDVNAAMVKANKMINEIMMVAFQHYPNIQHYKFTVKIEEIEELPQ